MSLFLEAAVNLGLGLAAMGLLALGSLIMIGLANLMSRWTEGEGS